jgi:choline dehydrogenase-like flavoprotein
VVLAGSGKGFWDQPVSDGDPWDFAGRWWGPQAVRRIAEYHRSLSVVVCTDDEAVRENRVTLADDWPADDHGPVPKVVYHPTPKTAERQTWLARRAASILRAAGAHTIHRTNIQPALLTHIMGTMRIGSDPATSVADLNGEAHQVGGLYVGDSSALCGDIGGPNPTLTAQALAVRTAERIFARLGGDAQPRSAELS